MQLSDLSKKINVNKIYHFKRNKYFSSITSNTKFADKHTILIVNTNSKIKKKIILESVQNNIPAIITNRYINFVNIPQFIVTNLELEVEKLIKNIYKNIPQNTVAVTGTNGKTSVVWYVSSILNLLNYPNSTVGTLGYYKNGKKINDLSLTTPAYEELFKFGSLSKNINETYIFEASSHALDQNRIRNYPIKVAAITNISNDHLDYHKSMSHYKKAKFKLFNKYLLKNGCAVINSRIKHILKLIELLKSKKIKIILFGSKNIFFKKKASILTLFINKNVYKINNLTLNSKIELENLECAIACCLALKIKEKKIVKTLPYIFNPPGRLQKIYYNKKKSNIIIDYAHTPEALKIILKSFKLNDKKPSLVFGCGGDRDKTKRKIMGKIAKTYSRKTYITDDNPRNENPQKIREQIIEYCPNAIEIPSRKKAILKAIKDLDFKDNLIIAGKGHEEYQIIKNKKIKLNDYKLVKEIIK